MNSRRAKNLILGGGMIALSMALFASLDRWMGGALGFVVFYSALMLSFSGGSMMRNGTLMPPETPKVNIVPTPIKQ